MLRIETKSISADEVRLELSGVLDAEGLISLRDAVAMQSVSPARLVLDLGAVVCASPEAIEVLAGFEREGARLERSPLYVESWLRASCGSARVKALFASLLVSILLAGGASAEAVPLQLSLKSAVSRALSEGTARKIATDRVEEARLREDEADSAFKPKVEAVAAALDQSLDLQTFGFSLPNGLRIIEPFGVFNAQVRAAVNVVDVSARRRRDLAVRGVEVSDFERMKTENEVAGAVATLYTLGQKAEAQIRAHEASVQLFEKLRQVAEDQRSAGVATKIDTTRAEVQLAREQQALLVAKSQRDAARLALLHVIGADQSQEIELTDALTVGDSLPPVDEALETAHTRRPEFAVIDARLRQAESGVSTAKSARLPVLSLQFQGGYSGYHLNDLDFTRSLAAIVSVPLYTGGEIGTQVKRAELMRHSVEIARTEAERQTEEEVRRALLGFDTARSRVALADKNIALASEELEFARDRFTNGVATGVEVDNAQTSWAAAQQDRIAALADQRQAEIDLARATGTIRDLIEPDNTNEK